MTTYNVSSRWTGVYTFRKSSGGVGQERPPGDTAASHSHPHTLPAGGEEGGTFQTQQFFHYAFKRREDISIRHCVCVCVCQKLIFIAFRGTLRLPVGAELVKHVALVSTSHSLNDGRKLIYQLILTHLMHACRLTWITTTGNR